MARQGQSGRNHIVKDEKKENGKGGRMIIPIRCFSCGKPIAHLYEEFRERTNKGDNRKKILDDLGLERYCCRAMFLGHVDLIDVTGQFKKF